MIESDDTFSKRLIPQGSQFLLIRKDEQVKKWYRFNFCNPRDRHFVGSDRWDACCFIPKKDVTVMGFGWYNTLFELDEFTFKFSVIVD